MGTRHLIAVVKDGKYKIAQYGQWDGYLEGQGQLVLDFCHARQRTNTWPAFEAQLTKCVFITQDEIDRAYADCGITGDFMTMEQAEEFKRRSPYGHLDRDTGARILDVVFLSQGDRIPLVDSSAFAKDSLFCEWAYVIDLDQRVLEIYEGFKTSPPATDERFAKAAPTADDLDPASARRAQRGDVYHPVQLLMKFSLADLPEALVHPHPETEE